MNTQKLNSAIAEFTKKKKSNTAYYEEPFLRLVGQGVGQQIFVLHQNFHLLLHRLRFRRLEVLSAVY